METLFLNKLEEEIIERLQQVIFSQDLSTAQIKEMTSGLPSDRRSLVIEAFITQLKSFLIARRESIIERSAKTDTHLTPASKDLIILALSKNELPSDFVDKTKIEESVIKLSKEYVVLKKRIENLELETILLLKVNPYFELLNKEESSILKSLINSIKSYCEVVKKANPEIDSDYNPPLSVKIKELLGTLGMGLVVNKLDELYKKINFLVNLSIIAQSIVENRESDQLNNEDLKRAIAKIIASQETLIPTAI